MSSPIKLKHQFCLHSNWFLKQSKSRKRSQKEFILSCLENRSPTANLSLCIRTEVMGTKPNINITQYRRNYSSLVLDIAFYTLYYIKMVSIRNAGKEWQRINRFVF